MTAYAVIKIRDTFFDVLGCNPVLGVCMTAIARISRQVVGVAGLASAGPAFTVIDLEGMRPVKLRRRPTIDGMTGLAINAEQAGVECRILVAL